MKIVIAGGSGQVGSMLAASLDKNGHEVVILSRSPSSNNFKTIQWDAETLGKWVKELDGSDVIINMAGRSVNCRYTKKNRKLILESRVNSTKIIGKAIQTLKRPPFAWLQSSTATIYAHTFDKANDEASGMIGGKETGIPKKWNFSIKVAQAWEETLTDADVSSTRKVALRSAIILSPDKGGIFDTLLSLVRFGLGGKAGSGKQFVSWIHYKDFIKSIYWLIENKEFDGIVNLASPNPLPFTKFMKDIRSAWERRLGLPATKFMLEIGAFFLRTETELILKSRKVVPGRLLDSDFSFDYPLWDTAVVDLVARWKTQKR
ncbi:MAG: TIGR01777 family protein [Candidatus Heimdallarchaeota archaeon]|nr:TIGR01777 family protein [Candidatus Heimdallarchaeota archaeon]